MSEPAPQRCWHVEEDFGIGKVRIAAPDADARLSRALGLESPSAGRMTRDDRLACIRLGPQEWTVIGSTGGVQATLTRIVDAFRNDHALVLDMSHGGLVLRLAGPQAIGRIAAYCDIDLHPASFPTDHATRTRFGDIAVTLARLDDRPSFWLIADQSYAEYLTLLLGHDAPPS